MKRLSLQWRITLMSVLLIGVTCVAMNLLLCSSGVYYMDTIADSLQGGGTVILNDSGAASFDPQLIAPNEELTIVVDGVQGRFRTTNWYITAAVTLLSGILAYFVSGRALKPLRSIDSDRNRTQRQRNVLNVIIGKAKSMGISEGLELLNEILPLVKTDKIGRAHV